MKIKVVWICHFSDENINKRLPLKLSVFISVLYKLIKGKKATINVADFAVWNINGINEMKKFTDRVELHIIAPYPYLRPILYEFSEDGINYHFFRKPSVLVRKIYSIFPVLYKYFKPAYRKNRNIVKSLIKKIQPSVVHIIGAENPDYSIMGLDIPKSCKLVVQLQTLMSDPKFLNNYPIDIYSYKFRSELEKKVLIRADYIGTTIEDYKRVILSTICPDAKFLDFVLASGEDIKKSDINKEYDFVYFARAINKSCDWAIESFIEASKIKSDLTMLVIGRYEKNEKLEYEKRLAEYNLVNNVFFTGELPSHEEVLQTVSKARIALLPLKFDHISGTIREAIALGLPVVTSVTDGTPLLNRNMQCIMLSPPADHKSMASNMIRLLDDPILAKCLVENSYCLLKEEFDNYSNILAWVEGYKSILNSKDSIS